MSGMSLCVLSPEESAQTTGGLHSRVSALERRIGSSSSSYANMQPRTPPCLQPNALDLRITRLENSMTEKDGIIALLDRRVNDLMSLFESLVKPVNGPGESASP